MSLGLLGDSCFYSSSIELLPFPAPVSGAKKNHKCSPQRTWCAKLLLRTKCENTDYESGKVEILVNVGGSPAVLQQPQTAAKVFSFARSCSGPVNAGVVSAAAAAAAAAAAFGSGFQDGGARKGRVSIGGPTSNNAAGGGCAGSPVSSPVSSPLSGICGGNKEFKESLEELVA